MTAEQQADLKNALLMLLFEWKGGGVSTDQVIKEIQQAVKFYAINDHVVEFREGRLRDKRDFEAVGEDKMIGWVKKEMIEKIANELANNGCVSFEEQEIWDPRITDMRKFMMKVEAFKQPHPGFLTITQPAISEKTPY